LPKNVENESGKEKLYNPTVKIRTDEKQWWIRPVMGNKTTDSL